MREKSFSTLGLDIGSFSIKCAEILQGEGKAELSRLARIPFTNPSREGVAAALRQLFSKEPFSAKKLRVAVSGPSLIIRRIQLPHLTYAELKGAIRFEAESHIPFPIDDCLLDFQILDDVPGKKQMNVLLVAAKRELVQERLQMVAGLGLDVELVDVGVFCTANAFEKLAQAPDERALGLLNIGHEGSSFAILHEKLPFYVREIAAGGRSVTKALAEARGIPEDEAEQLKTAGGAEVSAALEKALEPLVEELRHAIDYFENESGESLKWIGLSGGGGTASVSSLLSEGLGRQVSAWGDPKRLPASRPVDAEFLAKSFQEFDVALGLALRSVRERK